jgi:hypothetical protein
MPRLRQKITLISESRNRKKGDPLPAVHPIPQGGGTAFNMDINLPVGDLSDPIAIASNPTIMATGPITVNTGVTFQAWYQDSSGNVTTITLGSNFTITGTGSYQWNLTFATPGTSGVLNDYTFYLQGSCTQPGGQGTSTITVSGPFSTD